MKTLKRTITKGNSILMIEEDGSYEYRNIPYGYDPENLFGVKFEDGKVVEEPVRQLGIGSGRGEIITVKARWIIEEKIDELSENEIVRKAIENHVNGFNDGMSFVSLETGNFYGYGMSSNSSNQACDNNEIELHRIRSYEDEIDLDYEEWEFAEFGVDYNFKDDVREQLDDFYSDLEI